MAEELREENKRLKQENEALKQEIADLKKRLLGPKNESWNIFKSLKPGKRQEIQQKYKIKNTKKHADDLMKAAKDGDADKIEGLLEEGVPVDIEDEGDFRQTALMIASQWGHTHAVELLIANRADLDKKDQNGETALHKAAQWGRTEVVKTLVARGSKLDPPTKREKMTPLMVAAKIGHEQVCELLVKEGASVKVMNSYGQTAIQVARTAGKDDVASAIEKASEKRRKSKRIDPNAL